MSLHAKVLMLHGPGNPSIDRLLDSAVPKHDAHIDVHYSSINFKDALAVTGKGKIIRGDYPFVPGIDLAGTVAHPGRTGFSAGEDVILTGGGLGECTWGGYSQIQSVPGTYLLPVPDGMTLRRSMILGTAGLTAMLSVMALEHAGVRTGRVAVTGASGGVGMITVLVLSKLGYTVTASCQSRHLDHKLSALGAKSIEGRLQSDRPLERTRWEGVVDAAGGQALAAALAQTGRHGCVAASGNAAGARLATTVFPFILRGVTLAGIDSNTAPLAVRRTAWARLAELVTGAEAEMTLMATVSLEEVPAVCQAKMDGTAPGRYLVDLRRGM